MICSAPHAWRCSWPPLHAQTARNVPARGWVGLGMGGVSTNAATLLVELVYQRGPHQFMARGFMGAEIGGSSAVTADMGLLYGRGYIRNFGHIAGAAGAAYTVVPCTRPPFSQSCVTIGVPMQLGWMP